MVIELDLLITNEEDYWTKEVMQRAGESTLYIYGSLDGDQPGPRAFFASLLNENWQRIKRLDVIVIRGQHLKRGTWDVLFRASTELEIIRLQVQQGEEWYPRSRPNDEHHPPIFADTAPLLLEFSIQEAPVEWFSLQAPWLNQLHSLTLSTPFAFNATEVLMTLARIPALEYLVLDNVLPPTKEQRQAISLPHLHTLHISKDFTTSLFLLRWIVPSVGSTLILYTYEYPYIFDQDIHNFCKEITRYINNFFGCAPFARSLILEPTERLFKIVGWRSSNGIESSPDHQDFSISIAGGNNLGTKLPPLGPQKLLASLTACRFTHITTFEFQPKKSPSFMAMQPSLIAFLLSLHSVDHLVVLPHALAVLLDLQESIYDTIFPALRMLQLRIEANYSHTTIQVTDPVSRFLKWRIMVGKPLGAFDVSEYNLSNKWLDWTTLDDIEGLKVTLRRDKDGVEGYVCGTGTPERLNLRKGF